MRNVPILILLSTATATASLVAQNIEDGIYTVSTDESGTRVKRIDGGAIRLKKRLSGSFGDAEITSTSNDNSRFRLRLKNAGPLPREAAENHLALHIAGHCMPVSSRSALDGERMELLAIIEGREAAERIAKRVRTRLHVRKHPGHRFVVRWKPKKDKYRVGETITLEMAVENVGETAFAFWDGGMQRGARNNQFGFTAYRGGGHGRAVADTGDPRNFGGIAAQRVLKPGDTFVKEVRLSKWFRFDEPDTYRITGMFRMGIHAVGERRPAWDEFAVGECLVRVVAKVR